MQFIGVLGFILCCGFLDIAMGATTSCELKDEGVASNVKYTCILSNAVTTDTSETIQANHVSSRNHDSVLRVLIPSTASHQIIQPVVAKFSFLQDLEIPMGKLSTLVADSGLFGGSSNMTLKKIQFRNGDIPTWPNRTFQRCPSLTDLDLSNNKISTVDLNADEGLLVLERLNLADNLIITIPAFTFLKTLKVFNVSGNLITTLTSDLPSKALLEQIDLSRNKIAAITTDFFKEYVKLKELSLRGNNLTIFEATAFNDQLILLDLGSLKLTSFAFLKLATKLETLNLTDTGITQFTDDFFEGNLALVNLYAGSNKLTAITTTAFNKLAPKLTMIDVSNNRINNVDQDFFTTLTAINVTNFSCNKCISQNFMTKPTTGFAKEFEACANAAPSSIIISTALIFVSAFIAKFI